MTIFPVFSAAGAVQMSPARFASFPMHMRGEFLRLAREAGASEASLASATGLRDFELTALIGFRHAYRIASEGDTAPVPEEKAPLLPGPATTGGHPPRIAIALLSMIAEAPDRTLVTAEEVLARRLECKRLSVTRAFGRLLSGDLIARSPAARGRIAGWILTDQGREFLAKCQKRKRT